jgi:hypothetical protein
MHNAMKFVLKFVLESLSIGLSCYFVFTVLQSSQFMLQLSDSLQTVVYAGSLLIISISVRLIFHFLCGD